MKTMLICSQCKKAYSVSPKAAMIKCPECGGVLISTNISKDEWEDYDKKKKEEVKSAVMVSLPPEEGSAPLEEENPADRTVRLLEKINHDLHFMYIAVPVAIVLGLVGIIIAAIKGSDS